MFPTSKPDLPPSTPALSVVKLLAMAWFIFLPVPDRIRLLKILRWVSGTFLGPEQMWPMDFGRPLSQAVTVIENNRWAAAWVARLADQLEVIGKSMAAPGS